MPRRSRAELEGPQPVRLVAPALPVDLPPAPDHLSPQMKGWWAAVNRDFALDEHHLHLLQCACDSWDRMTQARTTLADEGLTVPTRDGGQKRHPACDIERDSRIAFMRAVRELDLDAEMPPERPAWRPPAIRSNRRR
jgi:P27 family predicted phage terminase small subunit